MISDEGFTDEDGMEHTPPPSPSRFHQSWMDGLSDAQRQGKTNDTVEAGSIVLTLLATELAYQLLMTLPRTQLAAFHRNLAPKLKVDIVGVSCGDEPPLTTLTFYSCSLFLPKSPS
jgi:hypothetical protein